MKQIAQSMHGGTPRLVEVPAPAPRPGGVIVRTAWTLVSVGTDRLTIDLAGKSLLGKARSRPDQVRKVLGKIRTEGLASTLRAVRSRLKGDLPLGYSAAGEIVSVGAGVHRLRVGQKVACAGMGYASHAELLFVPQNLCAVVPEGLPLREAASVTLGAIALQGVRRAEVVLGERVGVIGLGLLGLLTVQILRAAGCHVFAVDLDPTKTEFARHLGAGVALTNDAGDLAEKARVFGGGHGLDAVLVTAGSSSSGPIVLAGELSRLGGRVVVVGAVGMDVPRRLYFEKELDLRLARSYGPGRYDSSYEEKGIDYPYEWVRFTEGRNMEDYLSLLARGEVDVDPLLTREFGIDEGEEAYRFLLSEEGRSTIGLLLKYGEGEEHDAEMRRVRLPDRGPRTGSVGVAMIGAGAFARSVLLPALANTSEMNPTGVVTASGLSAVNAGRLGGFAWATTSLEEVFSDEETDAVVVATRHGQHAEIAAAALAAGKDVFLEKPPALDHDELDRLTRSVAESGRLLMVGYNRRFAPATAPLRKAFAGRVGPLHMIYRVNAGAIPSGHWTRDLEEGGGRILGEVCHFVDYLLHLAGCPPERVSAEFLEEEGVTATIRFIDGSVGTVHYAVSGDSGIEKERIEVYGDGTAAVLDNFHRLTIARRGRARRVRVARGKGHAQELAAFLSAVQNGGPNPVPFTEVADGMRATFAILAAAGSGGSVPVRERG